MKNILAKNALYNILYRVLGVIFPLVTATYFSRVLGPDGMGRVAYAQNVVSYFLMFAALGIPAYGTREIAKHYNSPIESSRLFSELLILNCLSTALALGVYAVLIPWIFPENTVIYWICALELLFNFANIDWFFQGREEYGYITLRSALVKLVSLTLMFIFVTDRDDYGLYALIHCFGIGFNYIYNIVHARKTVKITLRGLNLRRHMTPLLFLLISSVTASLYSKVDVTMLGWISSHEAVGYYTNAYKVIGMVLTLVTAISAVFLPRLSYVYSNDRERYAELLTKGLKIVLMLSIPGCVGLCLVAPELILVLFGDAFCPATMTVRILSALVFIRGVGDLLCYQAIISTGHERYLLKARVWASIANVALNSCLIPRYGQNGAAIASVFSELTVNGIMLVYSRSIARTSLERRFLFSILAGTGMMTVAVLLIRSWIEIAAISLLLSISVGVIVFFVTSTLLKNDMLLNVIAMLQRKR